MILPVLPNWEFGSFRFNRAKTWPLVNGQQRVSYGSYIIQEVMKGQSGILLAALPEALLDDYLLAAASSARAPRRMSTSA